MTIQLTSPAFGEGQPIPKRHSCDGEDLSPVLKWTNAPENTMSFALICDDPDAPMGTWVHWVLFNLPPETAELVEGVPAQPEGPDGAKQGISDFKRPGYGGPCPPPGKPHRYYFKLYALDTMLELKDKATKRDLEKAMEDHILAKGQLMGTYKR
ncbi:MAG: YbhB/YbcL family Raf kinase inhibitor-like protein [Candidatus Latescibacterota bacterium]|nr:MAG: YbhB/YbcL family Raf kinase inhibitor-like protein [Candidatus Latescibacterota bacterium]